MYSRRRKTHILYSIASNRCATQVVRMEDTNTASQGDRAGGVGWVSAAQREGWSDDFCAASSGSSFQLVPTGPRAAWLLIGWYGQVGHGSSEALLCLPNLSRVPACMSDAEGTHSVLQTLRGHCAWEEPSLQHPPRSLQHTRNMVWCCSLRRTMAYQGQKPKTLSGPGTITHPSHR